MARKQALAVLTAFLVGTLALPGHADTFPNNYDLSVADDSISDWCWTTSFTTDTYIALDAQATLDNTTDMTHQRTACLSYTDVWWYESNLSAGVRGQRTCTSYVSSGVCNSNDVEIDIAELDVGDNDWHDRRKTAVHELGHSVGLDHDLDSAMRTGEVPNWDSQWRNYSSHDIGHINTQY